ncbi:MAG: TrmB family transcriptional regulator [Halobacteriota archaeon]
MATEDEFTIHLVEFGLSDKEAKTYLYLLKYGPKTPSPLAKSLHTYREDMHRTLQSLIDKGMVRPSLDSPTLYTAVDIDAALGSALKKRESELREMEVKKQELQELSKQQLFRPVEEIATFKIIRSVRELTGVMLASVASIKEEMILVFPTWVIAMAPYVDNPEVFKTLLERGIKIRAIADLTCKDAPCAGIEPIEPIQELLAEGVDIRYLDYYHGLCFAVSDKKACMSIINGDLSRLSLNSPVTVLWTDDRAYARSLSATFGVLWAQSVPAAERIKKFLEERSHAFGA